MQRVRGLRWVLAVAAVAVMGLVGSACSGGGSDGGKAADDAIDGAGGSAATAPGESVVQFKGAGNLRLGGTLALPAASASKAVPGMVIVPTTGRVDRNGYLDNIPWDPIYQDLSKGMSAAGLASLRYDHRGIGTSKLDGKTTFDDMVSDAKEAVSFIAQRKGIDGAGLALVGHDVGGLVALRVAADDPRVKAVVLLSTPGRPMVDLLADSFLASHGQESAAAFRTVVAGLVSTGTLPGRDSLRPEHQPSLPAGQEQVLQKVLPLDPTVDAARVKVPVLVVGGTRSALVGADDAARLAAALGATATVKLAATNATLQNVEAAGPQAANPDHRAHGGGPVPDQAKRDQATLDAISAFMNSKLGGPRQ